MIETQLGRLRHLLRRRGIAVGRYPHTGSIDDHLAQVFQRTGTTCVIDAGASDGSYAMRLRRDIRYRGRIVSYEPGSQAFSELLRASADDPLWDARHIALGTSAGEGRLSLNPFSNLNSLHSATSYGRSMFGVSDEAFETVNVARLDADWQLRNPRNGHLQSIFLKTDTQGHDADVVEGARGLMPFVTAIQMELPLLHLYDETPSLGNTLDYVR